jgi:hypothetical protein
MSIMAVLRVSRRHHNLGTMGQHDGRRIHQSGRDDQLQSLRPGRRSQFYALDDRRHLSVGSPGWKHILIRPQPGGTITSAKVSHKSPYGEISCSWVLKDEQLVVDIAVPPNSAATVNLPGLQTRVGSGRRQFAVCWKEDAAWPPKPIYHSLTIPLIDEIA